MFKGKIAKIIKGIISLGVPVAICITEAIFPMRSVLQQGMIGLIFLWFEVELLWGHQLWP